MPQKPTYNSKNVFKTKKLTEIEKKYCSCLMKVLNNISIGNSRKVKKNKKKKISKKNKKNSIRKIGPYGICTKSVYGSRNIVRDKVVNCKEYYDFSKYPVKLLKKYAKLKKFKGVDKLRKKELISILKNYSQK